MCVEAFRPAESGQYQKTESTCRRESCSGTLWYKHNILLCRKCSTVVGMDRKRSETSLGDPWQRFWSNRDEYYHTKRTRMVGGYLGPYEWTTSEDTDEYISDMKPQEFYR